MLPLCDHCLAKNEYVLCDEKPLHIIIFIWHYVRPSRACDKSIAVHRPRPVWCATDSLYKSHVWTNANGAWAEIMSSCRCCVAAGATQCIGAKYLLSYLISEAVFFFFRHVESAACDRITREKILYVIHNTFARICFSNI